MSPFEKIVRHFERFPGIGSRQARRFAFHILTLDAENTQELSDLIRSLREGVISCVSCGKFHTRQHSTPYCTICSDQTRDHSKLTVVERDTDIDAIEKSGMYDGTYFVLGGTVPLLESKENNKLRGGMLKHIIAEKITKGLREVILGFSVNPDGENTERYIEMLLKEHLENNTLRISHLGRGLSTGSELEYADPDTIKNAFKNRT